MPSKPTRLGALRVLDRVGFFCLWRRRKVPVDPKRRSLVHVTAEQPVARVSARQGGVFYLTSGEAARQLPAMVSHALRAQVGETVGILRTE